MRNVLIPLLVAATLTVAPSACDSSSGGTAATGSGPAQAWEASPGVAGTDGTMAVTPSEDNNFTFWDEDIYNLNYCQIRTASGPDVQAAIGIWSSIVPVYTTQDGAGWRELLGKWGGEQYVYLAAATSTPVPEMCALAEFTYGKDLSMSVDVTINVGTKGKSATVSFKDVKVLDDTVVVKACVKNSSELTVSDYWSNPMSIGGWGYGPSDWEHGYMRIRGKLWVSTGPTIEFTNDNRSNLNRLCNCSWSLCSQ